MDLMDLMCLGHSGSLMDGSDGSDVLWDTQGACVLQEGACSP